MQRLSCEPPFHYGKIGELLMGTTTIPIKFKNRLVLHTNLKLKEPYERKALYDIRIIFQIII